MTELVAARYARQRAGRIRQGIRDYLTTLALIKQAWDERDWEALGYTSWQSYIDGEYSEHRLQLSPEHRQKAVAELRMAGMSQRAIASAVGVSINTVAKDLSQSETPEVITGRDGKTYAATRPTDPPGPDLSDLPGSPAVATTDRAAHAGEVDPVDGSASPADRGFAGDLEAARSAARTAPAYVAQKAIEALKVAREILRDRCGGVTAVLDDLRQDPSGRDIADLWVQELDESAEMLAALRAGLTTVRRSTLRSVK